MMDPCGQPVARLQQQHTVKTHYSGSSWRQQVVGIDEGEALTITNHSQTMVKLTDVFKEAFIYAQPSSLFEHKSPFIHIRSSFNTVRAKGQINEIKCAFIK